MALTINLSLTADATGTVDTITATYAVAPTLVDNKVLFLQTTGTNTGAVTFAPNGLAARPVVVEGVALSAGQMPKFAILAYDLDNVRWELLNPISSGGGGETLEQTLALGNVTGANDIELSDLQKIRNTDGTVYIKQGGTYVDIYGNGGGFYGSSSEATIYGGGKIFTIKDGALVYANYYAIRPTSGNHDVKGATMSLDFTNVNLPNETASRLLSTDSSSNVKVLSTSTYPSLTEISYVKGLSSSAQTQLTSKGYFVNVGFGSISPTNATTYYFGQFNTAPTTASPYRRIYIPRSGTLKAVYLQFLQNAGATAETSTFYFRLNDTTDTTLFSTTVNNAIFTQSSVTGLSTAVTAGDYFEIKWLTPTWVTKPTGVLGQGCVYIE